MPFRLQRLACVVDAFTDASFVSAMSNVAAHKHAAGCARAGAWLWLRHGACSHAGMWGHSVRTRGE